MRTLSIPPAEWPDNERVLYTMVDSTSWMSIMVVPSDGSGQPSIFAKGAASPLWCDERNISRL